MSEPIMELVGAYARAVEGGTGAQVEAAQAAIEREVAALLGRASLAVSIRKALTQKDGSK